MRILEVDYEHGKYKCWHEYLAGSSVIVAISLHGVWGTKFYFRLDEPIASNLWIDKVGIRMKRLSVLFYSHEPIVFLSSQFLHYSQTDDTKTKYIHNLY